jgi:histone deacetylase HOS3
MSSAPRLSIHIQPACAEHRYVRDKDLSTIVERPERLKALGVGLAAAIARTEVSRHTLPSTDATTTGQDELVNVMDKLSLQNTDHSVHSPVVEIIRHSSPADTTFLNTPAVRMIHALEGDNATGSGEEYISQLSRWVLESEDRIKAGQSEIPSGEGLSQGDLYRTLSRS